ncbi:MAG: hypothetical protein ACREJ3_08690, partial [Polyangiaceae bacterium]
ELEGKGRLAFCPCLGTPLAVRFSGATLAPPHDVILRDPVLEVFGVPVAWLPLIWLRSPGRPGLLPPDVAWRGADGFFAGGGVHMPWRPGDVSHGIDFHAGGYVDGGVAVDAAIRTTTTETRVTWDRFRGDDGIGVRAHGATAITDRDGSDSAAWDIDALRGPRSVAATTDVDAAARPFDRAEVGAVWRPGGWMVASGIRWVALRGQDGLDDGAAGPVLALRRSDAIGSAGTYDATLEGGALATAGGPLSNPIAPGPTTFARAEGGTLLRTRLGALGASLALRVAGDVADDGERSGIDGAAQARAIIALPLKRDYASGEDDDPWAHRTEPRIEVAAFGTHTSDVLVVPATRGMVLPNGGAWLAAGGWSNSVMRGGSRSVVEVDAVAGVVGDEESFLPVLRGRVTIDGVWAALRGELARVAGAGAGALGGAFIASGRLGSEAGLYLDMHVAQRDGVDPLIARALVDAPAEPASGFLSIEGWTGGARLGLPIGSRVTARGGADVDLDARELVATVGSVELHDPCNCVVVRASAAHRIGRGGVDAWLSVDLPVPAP